tara:strand:+ start:6642 stop:6833 length:192 start_codon:yes stop_codon:yes gene_type:complete
MSDTEQKRAYYRRYYRDNKEKYKEKYLDNRENISIPYKRVNKKRDKEQKVFSIKKGTFVLKFQ